MSLHFFLSCRLLRVCCGRIQFFNLAVKLEDGYKRKQIKPRSTSTWGKEGPRGSLLLEGRSLMAMVMRTSQRFFCGYHKYFIVIILSFPKREVGCFFHASHTVGNPLLRKMERKWMGHGLSPLVELRAPSENLALDVEFSLPLRFLMANNEGITPRWNGKRKSFSLSSSPFEHDEAPGRDLLVKPLPASHVHTGRRILR